MLKSIVSLLLGMVNGTTNVNIGFPKV